MKRLFCLLSAIALLGGGCAHLADTERDLSSPARALVGHWRMVDGSGEVYFSSDGTYSFLDRHGNNGIAAYEILGQDPGERTIITQIRLLEYNGKPLEEMIELTVIGRFSADYGTQAGESFEEGESETSPFVMEYADSEERPINSESEFDY